MIAAWIARDDPDARLSEREYLWSVALDERGECAVLRRVAHGTRSSVEAEVADILQVPLIAGSRRFLIAHNHPSQALYPTAPDMDLTRRIMEAGALCGIVLADHVIVGPRGDEFSLLLHGLIEPERQVAAKAAGREG